MASDEEPQPVINESLDAVKNSIELETDAADRSCQICDETLKDPKVLSCLHVFCQTCLEKVVEEESEQADGEPTKQAELLKCPVSTLCNATYTLYNKM